MLAVVKMLERQKHNRQTKITKTRAILKAQQTGLKTRLSQQNVLKYFSYLETADKRKI